MVFWPVAELNLVGYLVLPFNVYYFAKTNHGNSPFAMRRIYKP
jgi:hypothetical protein